MDIKDLQFVRLTQPEQARLIPRRLIDQAKSKEWATSEFFKIVPLLIANPLNIMGIFVDEENQVKGFLWASINVFTEQIDLILPSIDKEYQDNKGSVMDYAVEIMRGFKGNILIKKILIAWEIELKDKIRMTTKHPKAYEKRGWVETKHRILEI